MKNKQRGFSKVAVIIIVAIVITAAGWWYYQRPYTNIYPVFPTRTATTSPAVNPTANWQTYRNEQYGFEVKYPRNWRLDSQTIDSVKSVEDGFNRSASYIQIYPPDYLNTYKK